MYKHVYALLTFILFSFLSTSVLADSLASERAAPEKDNTPHKLGYDYFALNTDYFDFRALQDSASTAHGMGSSLVMGTYLTNWIKVEGRLGKGWGLDTVKGSLKAGIDYWLSWYMGLIYPITDFSTAYIQAGFSYVRGKTTNNGDTVSFLPPKFMSSEFSISWLAGVDLHVTGNWYLTGELGRLHADTATNIKTFMAGFGVKYEY
jgi:opacity protein-like surface antigen